MRTIPQQLIYVGKVDILEDGESIGLTVYAGNDLDSCISAIGKEIKAQKKQFKGFDIQLWINGERVETMNNNICEKTDYTLNVYFERK